MKLAVVSDLHVDIPNQNEIDWPEADILIVAGDTSNSAKATSRALNKAAEHYKQVLFVDGNHEHYSNQYHDPKTRTIESNLGYLDSLVSENVKRLSKDYFFEDDKVQVFGCNAWYSMDLSGHAPIDNMEFWAGYMNDHRIWSKGCRKQSRPDRLAFEHISNLSTQYQENYDADKKQIVVTHTVPVVSNLVDRPWDPKWQRASSFYYNRHAEDFLIQAAKVNLTPDIWFHGHTHMRFHTVRYGCEVVANPRGYPNENPSWEVLVMEI